MRLTRLEKGVEWREIKNLIPGKERREMYIKRVRDKEKSGKRKGESHKKGC